MNDRQDTSRQSISSIRQCGIVIIFILLACGSLTSFRSYGQNADLALATMRPFSLALSVPNIDESIKWYRDKLGFDLKTRTKFSATGVDIAIVEKNGFKIEFLKVPNQIKSDARSADPPGHLKVLGVVNLTFTVDDLELANEQLKAKGVELIWESKYFKEDNHYTSIFRDNNGNIIALWQNPAIPYSNVTRHIDVPNSRSVESGHKTSHGIRQASPAEDHSSSE